MTIFSTLIEVKSRYRARNVQLQKVKISVIGNFSIDLMTEDRKHQSQNGHILSFLQKI